MADRMNRLMLPLCSLHSLAALLFSYNAAPFADPTRPPSAQARRGEPEPTGGGRALESVLIAPDRRIAVISGQRCRSATVSARAEVVRITETEVVLRERPDQRDAEAVSGV